MISNSQLLPAHDPDALLRQIGNTPLIPLLRVASFPNVRIFVKAEWFNPGGSVKTGRRTG